MKTEYLCEFCNHRFSTPAEASGCEARCFLIDTIQESISLDWTPPPLNKFRTWSQGDKAELARLFEHVQRTMTLRAINRHLEDLSVQAPTGDLDEVVLKMVASAADSLPAERNGILERLHELQETANRARNLQDDGR